MIEQHNTRTCGNCGKPVAADDIVCAHCDALLAAYDAPAGATAGSSAAIDPVDMEPVPSSPHMETTFTPPPIVEPRREYESPTAQSLDTLDAQKPQAATISTTFDLPETSPVAEALRRTRIAADLDAQGERSAETEAGLPPAEEPKTEEPRQLFGMSVKPAASSSGTPTSSTTQELAERISSEPLQTEVSAQERLETIRETRREAQRIAEQATVARPVRPSPGDRVRNSTPPVRPGTTESVRKTGQMPGAPAIIIAFLMIMAVIRILASSPIAAVIIIPIIIVGLVWFMMQIAKRSGRKTTSMPRDKDFRN